MGLLFQSLTSLGLQGHCVPVLDFTFTNLDSLQNALRAVDNYAGIILTSQRAVEAVARATQDRDSGGGEVYCPSYLNGNIYPKMVSLDQILGLDVFNISYLPNLKNLTFLKTVYI